MTHDAELYFSLAYHKDLVHVKGNIDNVWFC